MKKSDNLIRNGGSNFYFLVLDGAHIDFPSIVIFYYILKELNMARNIESCFICEEFGFKWVRVKLGVDFVSRFCLTLTITIDFDCIYRFFF